MKSNLTFTVEEQAQDSDTSLRLLRGPAW